MRSDRTLQLRREALTPLATDELFQIVAGEQWTNTCRERIVKVVATVTVVALVSPAVIEITQTSSGEQA